MENDVTREMAGFERMAADLQARVAEQEEAFYSARVLEEAHHPRNLGAMLDPDGHGAARGRCGDIIEVFVRLDGERIELASFMTDGCGPAVACGSMLTAMAQGKTLDEAAAIDGGNLIIALDGLPAEHVHCATLAVAALRQALIHCGQKRCGTPSCPTDGLT